MVRIDVKTLYLEFHVSFGGLTSKKHANYKMRVARAA